MKNGLIKLASLLVYLGILLTAVNFHWRELFNLRLVMLVVFGAICLSFGELRKNRRKAAEIIGRNAISAGILETFLLFFADTTSQMSGAALTYEAVLCFRPLFYGYCIYTLLHTEAPAEEDERSAPPASRPAPETGNLLPSVPAPGDLYQILRTLGLTKRESEIAGLLLRGWSNGEIADSLCIAETTVKKHISNIFQKLEINRREDLAKVVAGISPP